jgi:hypothetical protein
MYNDIKLHYDQLCAFCNFVCFCVDYNFATLMTYYETLNVWNRLSKLRNIRHYFDAGNIVILNAKAAKRTDTNLSLHLEVHGQWWVAAVC